MEFLLTPGKVTIVIEAYTQVRHIYTDGRPLPEDPDLKFHGTSVGRWEGNALVVDTIGFSPLTDLAANVPHGEKMRIRERFTLTGPDTMSIETTVTDPDVLTAPYHDDAHAAKTSVVDDCRVPSARKTIATSWTKRARPASVSTIRPGPQASKDSTHAQTHPGTHRRHAAGSGCWRRRRPPLFRAVQPGGRENDQRHHQEVRLDEPAHVDLDRRQPATTGRSRRGASKA